MKISLSSQIIIDRVCIYVLRRKISKQALVSIHSSVGGETGGSEPSLFLGYFSVSLDKIEIDDLESSQLLYIHLALFCAFITEVGAS